MVSNIYLELTHQFNNGRKRAVLTSGQAVVLHRLAVMSKDGDWILREDAESLEYVIRVLEDRGAVYRFGAPLDVRWLALGWSSHFEFQWSGIRVRTDFFTRPPRLTADDLERIWRGAEKDALPYSNARDLAELKKTNRLKDYAIIGELARTMKSPSEQLLYSRSARDLLALAEGFPELVEQLRDKREILGVLHLGRDQVEEAIDRETRRLMRENEDRLARFFHAGERWKMKWPVVSEYVAGRPLSEAHTHIVAEAEKLLPLTL